MHDPFDAKPLAGSEQSGDTIAMDALDIVARPVLQRASAIDDRIDAFKIPVPVLRLFHARDVDGPPARYRLLPRRDANRAGESDDLVPFRQEASHHRRSDQTGRSRG